ncbi:hypothetical protein KAU32_00935, partial [bacterium]|nr:hypothetical protein [bacterium]
MKAKFVLFVFLFCNAILFSATHLIPMYNIPSGDSNIFIDVSSYGDSDAEIRVAQGPSNFSINISDPTIPATSSGPVEKMISLQGVPASSFEDFAVFEIRNLYGEPHPRQFRVNFHYDMEISLDYSDVIYYYNSYFLSGETSECPCFNGIQRDYLSDVEGVEVFGNSGFYYTCENIDGNWKFVEYTDHYKLYHSLYCIGSFPFTANSNDRIGTVLLEILNASDIPVYSDLIDLSDQDLLNTSGSFSVDFSYIEGSDSNVFIEGTYQVQLTLTSRSGSSLKSEKKTIYIETSESYIETTAGNVPGTVISDDQQVIVMVPENSLEQPDLLTIDLIDSDTILSELSLEEISPASSVYDITLAQSALTGDASVTILYDDSELTLEEEFALVPLIWNADDLAWEDASSGFADVIKDVENNQIILISEHFSLYVIGLYPMDSQALHFTWISVENSYFSPNSDLIKDSLQVDVELNSPATVFYSVYDLSMSNIMASGQASYNDETPFSVFWNGKEENDQLLADGEYLLKVYASNGSETTSANIFKAIIDTGSPELYISGVENNGLYNNYVFPAISHKDENGSIVCVTDNGTEIFPDYSIGAPGAHTLNATVSDPAGNEASQTLNFTIDLAPPSVLLKVGDPFYFSLDLYISAMTLMGFEVSEGTALYSFDNANWISYSQDFVNGLPEGERRIYYYGTDLAGNRSTTKSYIFYNDYSPPESGIEFHNAYNNGTTQFAGEFSSISMSSYDVLSGLYAEYLKIDQDTYSEYQDSLDLAGLSEGNHTVSYYSEDNVVNIEDENIYSFMMDLTPPAISITATPSNLIAGQLVCYKNSVLEISGQDLLSGYSYAQYSISQDINEADFLNYTDPVVLSEYDYGEYYVKARGYDNIGNVSQIVDAILFIVPNVEVETDNCEPLNILVYSDADCSELEQVLIGSQEIWKVDIADTANIFDEKLRSGLFNGMVLLNGKNMKGTVSGKVSEYAYW